MKTNKQTSYFVIASLQKIKNVIVVVCQRMAMNIKRAANSFKASKSSVQVSVMQNTIDFAA